MPEDELSEEHTSIVALPDSTGSSEGAKAKQGDIAKIHTENDASFLNTAHDG